MIDHQEFTPFHEVMGSDIKEYNVSDESGYIVQVKKPNPQNHSDQYREDFSNPVVFYNIGKIIEGNYTKKYKKDGSPTKEQALDDGEIWIYESDTILDACAPIVDNSLGEKLVVVVRYDKEPISGENYTKTFYRKLR